MALIFEKATADITCDRHLLIFDHVDDPEAGLQGPSGTVDGDEDLERAVLRGVGKRPD